MTEIWKKNLMVSILKTDPQKWDQNVYQTLSQESWDKMIEVLDGILKTAISDQERVFIEKYFQDKKPLMMIADELNIPYKQLLILQKQVQQKIYKEWTIRSLCDGATTYMEAIQYLLSIPMEERLNCDVLVFRFNTKLFNALQKLGVTTIQDLKDLIINNQTGKIKGIGNLSIEQIKTALFDCGVMTPKTSANPAHLKIEDFLPQKKRAITRLNEQGIYTLKDLLDRTRTRVDILRLNGITKGVFHEILVQLKRRGLERNEFAEPQERSKQSIEVREKFENSVLDFLNTQKQDTGSWFREGDRVFSYDGNLILSLANTLEQKGIMVSVGIYRNTPNAERWYLELI